MSGSIISFPSLTAEPHPSQLLPKIAKYDYSNIPPANCCGPFKVLLLGDASVGKTSLIRRFTNGKYDHDYRATIGIDFKRKLVQLDNDRFVKLQIWDTAGQERFRGLAKNYYRGADAVILVYDVTFARTFVDVPSWLEELEAFSMDERDILQIIVANKTDLPMRQVSTECGQALADKFKLDYIETSAKSGFNVDLIFTLLAESLCIMDRSATKSRKSSPVNRTYKIRGSDVKLRDYRNNRKNNVSAIQLDNELSSQRSNENKCEPCGI